MATVETGVLDRATTPPATEGGGAVTSPTIKDRVKDRVKDFLRRPDEPVPDPESGIGVKRHEMARTGATSELTLSMADRMAMGQSVRERLGVSKELAMDKKTLNVIDRLLIQRGEEITRKLDGSSELSTADLALTWAVIQDDLRQKASSARLAVDEQPAKYQTLKTLPVIGGIFARYATDATTMVVDSDGPRMTGDYIKTHGISEWSEDRVITELTKLNELRVALEGKLGYGERSAGRRIPDFDDLTGDLLNDATAKSLRNILERDHEGRTITELRNADREAAARAEQKAIQEGLVRFNQDQARALLISERPDVEVARIDRQITKIDEPADPKVVEEKTKVAAEATEKYDEAKERHEALQAELANAKDEAKAGERACDQAERALVRRNDLVDDGTGSGNKIGRLEKNIADLEDAVEIIKSTIETARKAKESPPSGLDAKDEANFIARQDAVIAQQSQSLSALTPRLETRQTEFDTLRTRVIEAEENRDYWKTEQERLAGKGRAKGEVAKAKREMDTLEGTKKTADQELKDLTEPTEEKKDRKQGLTIWKSVMDRDEGVLNYEKIISTGFAQGGDEARFTQEQFADITPVDGEFAGAELLRESIFSVIKGEWDDPKNKEIIRKMVSDEAIGRGIVRVLGIDTTDFDLNNLLPRLAHVDQMFIGDLTRFLVTEGLRSAEKGDPYLKVHERYAKTKAETKDDVMGILEDDLGVVKLEHMDSILNKRISWEGPIREAHGLIFGVPGPIDTIEDTELNVRVTEEFNRGLVYAGVEIEVNEQFLKLLPLNVIDTMPESIRNYFYTEAGVLRTELRTISDGELTDNLRTSDIPQWLSISDPALPGVTGELGKLQAATAMDMLNMLDATYSADIPRNMTTQVANKVLKLTPEQRLDVIKGLPDFNVNVAMLGTAPEDMRIRFDNNGDFWISDGGEEMELEAFYDRAERVMRGDRQVLPDDEWHELQNGLRTIQSHLGIRILENQQSK